jgi:hypothetical protein
MNTGEHKEKPVLDEDWKDLVMMVDYSTGATSSVPPTAIEEYNHTSANTESQLPLFQHWSSLKESPADDPLL